MDMGQEKVLKLHKVHFINESNTFIVRLVKNSEKNKILDTLDINFQ